MAIVAPITINDGKATPVAVTFNPGPEVPEGRSFEDRTAGVSIGFRRLTVSTRFAKGNSTVNRSKLSLELPVTTTVNGVTSVAYTLRGAVELILPVQSTDAERKDVYAFLQNALANALVKGALRDLDPIYG